MCGINGFNSQDREKIDAMNGATKHRGPDGVGNFVDENVSFGHNLLAIIEKPENSHQPWVSDDKNYVLTYNGEIYNYKELRNKLEAKGDKFITNSDTEVLFNGLTKYGYEYLSELDGMFALAFYDKRKQTVLLARDHGGMKPLYYHADQNSFAFSSELRGLFAQGVERKLDVDSAHIYFVLGYVPGYKTLIRNVKKVSPGQYLQYDLKTKELNTGWIELPEKKSESSDDSKFRQLMHDS
ncbi:MAG: asparagine synthetase B, partial [Parcubacteria group bacterium]